MEWVAVLGILLPSGLLSVGFKLVRDELHRQPYIECKATRARDRPERVFVEVMICNRRDKPLPIRCIRLTYPEGSKMYDHAPMWDLRTGPVFYSVDAFDIDHRLPPFLAGSADWPQRLVSMMVAPVPAHVLKVELEVQMSWRRLWRSEESRLLVVPISPS